MTYIPECAISLPAVDMMDPAPDPSKCRDERLFACNARNRSLHPCSPAEQQMLTIISHASACAA
jgi:hypothetical protein